MKERTAEIILNAYTWLVGARGGLEPPLPDLQSDAVQISSMKSTS